MTPWSNTELRRTAASIPAGMPMTSAKTMAQRASSMVAGNSAANSRSTGSCVIIDFPGRRATTRPM